MHVMEKQRRKRRRCVYISGRKIRAKKEFKFGGIETESTAENNNVIKMKE